MTNQLDRIAKKLDPYSTLRNIIDRAQDFIKGDTVELYKTICQTTQPGAMANLLLTGIFLSLQRQLESVGGSANYDLQPYSLSVGQEAMKVLEPRSDARPRRVLVWVDPMNNLPSDTVVRWSTTGSKFGPALLPGQMNELGRFPGSKQLYLSLHASGPAAIDVWVSEET